MSAAYPASLLNWTNRINSQTIFAADPNTLAAEIDAIEQFVGVNPHIESSALLVTNRTFTSLSARVSDAMLQKGHPFIQIVRTNPWNVPHSTSTTHVLQNPYNINSSIVGNYIISGGTITIQNTGLWLVNAEQVWSYAQSGWVMMELRSGSTTLRRNVFSYSQFPQSGSNTFGERFLGQSGHTETTYLGRLNAGTVISVSSGNFTNVNPLAVNSMSLSMYYLRP